MTCGSTLQLERYNPRMSHLFFPFYSVSAETLNDLGLFISQLETAIRVTFKPVVESPPDPLPLPSHPEPT